ncbi:MMPL family transporter [Nocardia terpenica]|uniref:MMPL family transporter n=1 Tax=Nocardia terpenica TaxID=455432 RepID=A0A6G9ZD69_9NOCA|nr:MMPL family transporter [Nocardia terpenica]QIS23394.1 MMPL family transporter [Nocardia terpenica]
MMQFDIRAGLGDCDVVRRWADLVVGRRYVITAAGVLAALLAGILGIGVFDRLDLSGYTVPGSQSSVADDIVNGQLGRRTPDVVVHYSVSDGRTISDMSAEIRQRLDAIDPNVLARPVQSYWSADPVQRAAYVSGRTETLAVLTLRGDDSARLHSFRKLRDELTVPGIDTSFSGYSAVTDAYNTESEHDLVRIESIAVPVTLVLLAVVFGSLAAAAVPIVIGCLTIFASLGALRLIAEFTAVSSFAVNTASIIGLGMAIDYGLFIVSRFREELAAGAAVEAAVRTTIVTACRTVMFSGLILVCAFLGMMVFPLSAMRSLGFGAMSAVGIAAVLSCSVVPAALAIMGDRIDALPVGRRGIRRGEDRSKRFWFAFAGMITRKPLILATGIMAILILCAAPVLGVHFSNIDSSGLPERNPTRLAQETITQKFPNATNGVDLIVRDADGNPPGAGVLASIADKARGTEGVRMAVVTAKGSDFAIVHAILADPDFTTAALNTVTRLRAIEPPEHITLLAGGENAVNADSYHAIIGSFPAMAMVMTAAILVLMWVAFRSVLLPVKAVVMSGLSLAASLGVVTWIFQDGHGTRLLGAAAGPLPVAGVVIVVATVFGLSTDYEVFLISRMVEARVRGLPTRAAVVAGVAGTGRVVTAAAAMLMIVTGAAALSGLMLVKLVGIGMAVAILIDATLVRMILVPALVTLMGEANWWSPIGNRARAGQRESVCEKSEIPEGAADGH